MTAVQMLTELADNLESSGVQLAIAHAIGQVRDLITTGEEQTTLQLYPTVNDASAAFTVI